VVDPEHLLFAKCSCTTVLSARALARSVPNGFSMMTRRQLARLPKARPPRLLITVW
jgi:hypothetical protein